ncbi:MAG TPA: serine/threonine-protein kinase [Kofleriaceae bacterium]
MEHLDDNAASEFVSGMLSGSALGRVEGHLAACRDCRALVAALAADSGQDSVAVTMRREVFSEASDIRELPQPRVARRDRVGRYIVLSALGVGGMGVVFAAYDPQLGRKVALKLLRPGLAGSSKDARTRLRREAQAIAQLSHPHVVSIYDVGTTDEGALYIAMEFVEGDTLTSWLRKYPRDWREILDVFRQAARGLVAAHSVGLLHRDFKPDNVLVGGDGRVRVTDFGLARSVLAADEVSPAKPVITALDVALTATGTVLGTPRYMPPEQLTGPDIDARSDQFSFCVALYEALYGSHPLPGGTSVSMLDHGDGAAPPPESTRVPAAIGRAVLRGLERDRSRRFPSMSALIAELEVQPRRSRVRYAGLVTAASLVVGGATWALVGQPQPSAAPPPDVTTIDALVAERDRSFAEVRKLRDIALHAKVDAAEEAEKIERLRAALKDREDTIQELTETITQLQTATRVRGKAARVGRPPPAIASDALDSVLGSVQGCFNEWGERLQVTLDGRSEATLVVRLTVTPDGFGTMPRIASTPDQHPMVAGDDQTPALSSLELCVSAAVVRVRYPSSSEELDVEVTAQWSNGSVRLSPKVVGHHPVPLRRIELP